MVELVLGGAGKLASKYPKLAFVGGGGYHLVATSRRWAVGSFSYSPGGIGNVVEE